MGKLGFYYDMSLCIGCRTCQIACKDKNNLEVGTLYRQVRNYEVGDAVGSGSYFYASTCNHCENPQCVANCPAGAMYIADDGTVQHDDEACIGCQYCVKACPYGVPQYKETDGITGKCDACAGLRSAGEQPACVAACLMRCLDFGDLDELRAKYGSDLVSEIAPLPAASTTNPSVLIAAKPAALEKGFQEKRA